MDFAVMGRYVPQFTEALFVTLTVSFWGILWALAVGLLIAVVRLWKVGVLTPLMDVYVEVARNTPSLVQLFFLYFGLPKVGVVLRPETCAIVCLAFLGAAYMAEAFRAALEAVPVVQFESAQVLGLTRTQTLARVVLPQAMRQATPAIVANVVFLVKESSIVSGIALADLMYVAKDVIGMNYDTTEALFLLVVYYAVILVPVGILGAVLERRFV